MLPCFLDKQSWSDNRNAVRLPSMWPYSLIISVNADYISLIFIIIFCYYFIFCTFFVLYFNTVLHLRKNINQVIILSFQLFSYLFKCFKYFPVTNVQTAVFPSMLKMNPLSLLVQTRETVKPILKVCYVMISPAKKPPPCSSFTNKSFWIPFSV